jgi:hypothetical protein
MNGLEDFMMYDATTNLCDVTSFVWKELPSRIFSLGRRRDSNL